MLETNNYLCGVRKAVIFYFYDNPEKDIILKLYKEFNEIFNPIYTYYSYDNTKLKKIDGDYNKFIEELFNEMDFNKTNVFTLTNATKKSLQNFKLRCSLRNNNLEVKLKVPNWIYFECPENTEWNDILYFIKNACYTKTYFYICSNNVVSINDFAGLQGNIEAIEIIKNTFMINSDYSILMNPSFLLNLTKGIDGPNLIQVLSANFLSKVGFENILREDMLDNLRHEMGENYVIIDLLKYEDNTSMLSEKYHQIYQLLKPIIINIEKPKMYWKDEEWNEWRRRFSD